MGWISDNVSDKHRRDAADQPDDDDERHAADRDQEVRRDARERDDDVAALEVPVVARNDRNRLRAAERDLPS